MIAHKKGSTVSLVVRAYPLRISQVARHRVHNPGSLVRVQHPQPREF